MLSEIGMLNEIIDEIEISYYESGAYLDTDLDDYIEKQLEYRGYYE